MRQFLVMILTLSLIACTEQNNFGSHIWTQAEVDAVFDLTELGQPSFDPRGNWLLGGKRLNPSFVTTQTYGRKVNLLGLEDSVYNRLPPVVADAIFFATPEQIRKAMKEYGLSMADLRQVQKDGVITLDEFRAVAARIIQKPGNEGLLQALNLE